MLRYSEGTVFLVPLPTAGFIRGVVARNSPTGMTLGGYFFGPVLNEPGAVKFDDLAPSDSILRVRFMDLDLRMGKWPVVGTISEWDRSKWTMPDCVIRDGLTKRAWRARYSDMDTHEEIELAPTDFYSDLEPSLFCGDWVHDRLEQILNSSENGTESGLAAQKPAWQSAQYQKVHCYLNFKQHDKATSAAAKLKHDAFQVDVQQDSEGVKWLVTATVELIPTKVSFDELRKMMKEIAKTYRGKYDGWKPDNESEN